MIYLKQKRDLKLVHFRKWQRRSYSAFSSLGRIIKICALAFSYSLLIMPSKVNAQKDTSITPMKEIDLDEVVVTGSRTPDVYSEIARIVTIISKDEIEQAPVYSVSDLLEYAHNVDIRQRGLHGVQADVNIRGGSFNQTMILLNGIPITDPQTGHHNLNLPVDIESVKRIEILEGSASRIWGPNAFSGAINVITDSRSELDNLNLSATYGAHNLYKVNLHGNYKIKNYQNHVSVSKSGSDGYIHNTDFKSHNYYYQGKFDTGNSNLNIQFGQVNKAFGANSFYSLKYPDQFEETKTTLAVLTLKSNNKLNFTSSAYWRRNLDHYVLIRNKPEIYQNFHESNVFGSNMNSNISSGLGITSVGFDIRAENLYSTVLGNEIDKPLKVPNTDSNFYTHQYNRINASNYWEHKINSRWINISTGVLVFWNSDLLNKVEFFPGLDVSFNVSDGLKIYGSTSKSLRLPTFTELFYEGRTNIGNPNLKPEEAINFETGFKYQNSIISANATYYLRKGTGLIDWIMMPSDTIWYSENLTKIITRGYSVSFSLKRDFFENFGIPGNFMNISYVHTEAEKNMADSIDSYYVLDNLKSKFTVNYGLNIFKGLNGSLNVTYQNRNGAYQKYLPETDEFINTSYESFWLVDARLSYNFRTVQIYLDASNILDQTYFDLGGIQQPGLWLKGGIKLSVMK